jgi:bifunctional non-homologous end joining protein LigD
VWLNDEDLSERPLLERNALLKCVLPTRSAHYVGVGTHLFQAAQELDLEGIIAKRVDSLYAGEGKRSPWFKIKTSKKVQPLIALLELRILTAPRHLLSCLYLLGGHA